MEFNTRQKKVINAEENNILCLAGAGSGKSAVLIERVDRLIKEGVDPSKIVVITFTNLAANSLKKRFGERGKDMYVGTIHGYANYVALKNGLDTTAFIQNEQFDKIISRTLTLPISKYPQLEHLLVDEVQDISELERTFLEKIPSKNKFMIGDGRQCQPAGSKIYLRNGIIKNIEDVEIGDDIIFYNTHQARLSGDRAEKYSVHSKVLKTASREFVNDNLLTITTEDGHSMKCTSNHICLIKMHNFEDKKNYHIVYLMCDNNYRFRIGKIPLYNYSKCHSNPWRDKLYQERCTKFWILGIFETDKEARVMETKLSYKYQIPQTCWQLNKVTWTKEDIDYIYEGLDTKSTAEKCLKEFNRDINFPMIDRENENNFRNHFAKNAVAEIYAYNIIPEIMDFIIMDRKEKTNKRYDKIIEVKREFITEPIIVYSLETEHGTYVTDEIITHNCIYGFRNGDVDNIKYLHQLPEFTTYNLCENYRNTPNIINFAEDFIHSINYIGISQKPIKTLNGTVEETSFTDALEELEYDGQWGDWFVLCRTNAEIEEVIKRLQEKEIPYISFSKKEMEGNIDKLEETMKLNKVKVMTIHGAKGLESKKVIVTGARCFNDEERRISYVAATRAENALYWCPSIAARRKKSAKKTGIKKGFS